MFKKGFSIFFVIAVIGAGLYGYFIFPYHIKNEPKSIEKALSERINNTESTKKYILLHDVTQLDTSDTYAAMFTVSGDPYFRGEVYTGIGLLKKGILNKLTITSSSYETKTINYKLAKTNKGNYLVFAGVNETKEAKKAEAAFATFKKPVILEIPAQEFFISYQKTADTFEETRYPVLTIQ